MILIKKFIFPTILLITLLFIFNHLIFGQQLNYGFRDVDWEMLLYYKIFGNLSLNHLFSAYKLMGAYTYELYYVGLLEKVLGLNFVYLHGATQIFKVISGLSVYLLVLVIFKKKSLALLSSLIYTISYTHAGAMFMLATGGYFFAIIFMNLFLITYYYTLLGKKYLIWFTASFLLFLTLILNTERMYPLILLVVLIEFSFVVINKFRKQKLFTSLKRGLIILLPIIIFSFVYSIWSKASIVSTGFSPNQFFIGIDVRIKSILNGNWQLLLYPFASFGSLFLYGDYWKYFGQVNAQGFINYVVSLAVGPLLRLGIINTFLFFFIFKKWLKLTIVSLLSVFVFGIVIYWMINNWLHLNSGVAINFDFNQLVTPALFGFFTIIVCLICFFEWRRTNNKELLPLIIGPIFTLVFIFLTWVASDVQLLFMGPHRYLSIPSIGTSLFISGISLILFNRLRQINFTHTLAWIIFLFLVPLIIINYRIANDFFIYELSFAGMRGEEQAKMKNIFYNFTPNIDQKEPSLFYFDETEDKENGYFDESTILAGFEFWTNFNGSGELEFIPKPGMLRTNIHQCAEVTHKSCLALLKEDFFIKDGIKGFMYNDVMRENRPNFYKLSNFYAFRFINKNLIDIKKEVLEELNITP